MLASSVNNFSESWPTLDAWMEDVNNIVLFTIGTGIEDLPDLLYADAYEVWQTPKGFCLEHLGILNGRIVDPNQLKEVLG